MFVFDTNIVSATMTPRPSPEVRTWMSRHDRDLFFTTTIVQAEILSGLAVLPEGRRRGDLLALATAMFAEDFEDRILPFDSKAAEIYAILFAARRRAGKPSSAQDLMIAAIARSHGATVVTRDTGGFEGCGLTIVNPWAFA